MTIRFWCDYFYELRKKEKLEIYEYYVQNVQFYVKKWYEKDCRVNLPIESVEILIAVEFFSRNNIK